MVQGTATTPAARVLSISLDVGSCQQIFVHSGIRIPEDEQIVMNLGETPYYIVISSLNNFAVRQE